MIDDITLNTASICNLALSHLGMKAITDIDTDVALKNPSAVSLNKHWGPCRNDVFREFKWPFATVIEPMELMTSVDTDDYPEWQSFYTYPAAACTVWYVYDSSTVSKKHERMFEIVYNPDLKEKVICCNCDTTNAAYCEYTYNVTDPTSWDTKFVMAFSYRLASAICMELVGDEKRALSLMNIYNAILHEAKRIAHSEKKRKPDQSNPIVDARG